MLRSFAKLQQVEAGYSTENELTLSVDLNWASDATPQHRIDRERALRFHEQLQERVRAVPGVVAGAAAWTFPLNSAFNNDGAFQVEGRDPSAGPLPRAVFVGASPDYFSVVGVPVLAGRAFDQRDQPPQPGVVIVSDALARRYFGGSDAVGRRISGDGGRNWRTIVGVVGNVRQRGLEREAPDMVYLPFLEVPGFTSILFVRTQGDPLLVAEQARRSVHQLDPQAAVSGIQTLEQIRHESLASPRLTTVLLGLMAGLALALSAAGIGGVVAYSVSQRTQEIGIRMAMGAERSRVLTMILGQGLRPIGLGLGLGLLGALALGRLMADLLFGVQPTDPLCFTGSAAVLLLVSLVACLVPARRATHIEPILALRADNA
jgi:putative ABC transport system permease protein